MIFRPFSRLSLSAFVCAAGLILAGTLSAQDVFPGNEAVPLTPADGRPEFASIEDEIAPLPPAEGPIDPKADRASVEINLGNEVSAVPKRFQYGFRLTLRGVYDDNIFLTRDNEEEDFYFAIEPGVTLGFGDIVARQENYIRLDYAPSIFFFVDNSDANAVQHLIRLEGQYRFSRLTLTLGQDFHFLEGANLGFSSGGGVDGIPNVNLDAGGDTDLDIYATRANFAYELTGKTFLSGGIIFNAYEYSDLISSESILGNLFLNYIYSPKLVVGLGGGAGYNWVESPSPDQTFQQINGRLTYQLTGKISLTASGGVEFRQFEESDEGDYISPVYELGATYQPFDGTTLTARGSRRTLNSAVFANQNYAATSIVVGARQRLLQRIYLGVAAGYENSNYFETRQGVDATRDDNYYFVQPAIDVTLTRWWTVGAYYLHRRNDSDAESFGFRNNQVGLRTSLTY